MTRHFATPCGRLASVGDYVRLWRAVRALPSTTVVTGWDHFPCEAGDVLRDLRRSLHHRINRHTTYYQGGRKWESDWQRSAALTARYVNTPRLIVRWVPIDLRARLHHRLHIED
jgi:hypothetical protein